jgi:outer membrane usher protein
MLSRGYAVYKILFCLSMINLFQANISMAQIGLNEVVLSIIVNGEKKGDLFALIEEDKIYLPVEDLLALGLKKIGGDRFILKGREYVLINTWNEASLKFNEERAELEIIIPPPYLPETKVGLMPERRKDVIIPEQDSAFFNYRLDFYSIEDKKDFLFNHELGLRIKDWSFVTEGYYKDEERRYIRLNTSAIHDNRQNLTRLVLGDFITPSGPLSSSNLMGGISYFKNFRIDPYYIYKPTFNINTFATFRSELEIYLDNMLLRRETVSPGSINIGDLYYYGGRRDVQIILKDPYGRTETYRYPFYFADTMLKEGVREFNYSIGFLRKNYSIDSNNYGKAGFLAFERYGLNRFLNIGGRLEGIPSERFYNSSLEATILLDRYGLLSVLPSLSKKGDLYGIALLSSYTYQHKNLSLKTSALISSPYYFSSLSEGEQIRESYSSGLSYFINRIGSFSTEFTHTRYSDHEKDILNVGYSTSLKGKVSLYANFTKKYEQESSTEFFIGVSIYPEKNHTLSGRYEDYEGRRVGGIQFTKTPPSGEGYGYRITGERGYTSYTYNSLSNYLQYRTYFGITEAELSLTESPENRLESYRISQSGAITYVANTLGLTRPVKDSFALIKTADLKDIKVTLNGQDMGKTKRGGYLFLPELNSYYDNIITINDKDIPLEYDLLKKEFAVSPWYKSGFCLEFPVKRVFRYVGKLSGKDGDKEIPLEFYEITLENLEGIKEKEKNNCIRLMKKERFIKVPTGKDGEFYIEELPPGNYKASIEYNGKPLEFMLLLPEKKEFIIDIGKISISLPGKTLESVPPVISAPQVVEEKEEEKLESSFQVIKKEEETIKKEQRIIRIYFKFDSTELASEKDLEALKELIKTLRSDPSVLVEIFGHCDQLGSRNYNKYLSKRRANRIASELIKSGIKKERIIRIDGFGKDYPICKSLKECCRKYNRRVEIYLEERGL